MRPWKIITNLLLILLLSFSASGLVSAKVASGPQNLSVGLLPGESLFNALSCQEKTAYSTTAASGCSVVAKGVDPNKLKHIFGQERHNLSGVVKQFGSEEKAFDAIQQATEAAVGSQGLKGVFETTVKFGSETITVRGNVVDGVVKIGTAFVP